VDGSGFEGGIGTAAIAVRRWGATAHGNVSSEDRYLLGQAAILATRQDQQWYALNMPVDVVVNGIKKNVNQKTEHPAIGKRE